MSERWHWEIKLEHSLESSRSGHPFPSHDVVWVEGIASCRMQQVMVQIFEPTQERRRVEDYARFRRRRFEARESPLTAPLGPSSGNGKNDAGV